MFELIFSFILVGGAQSPDYRRLEKFETREQCEYFAADNLRREFNNFPISKHGYLAEIKYMCNLSHSV